MRGHGIEPVNVGIVGATGAVGEVILDILEKRKFPVGDLRLFASTRSAGSEIDWRKRTVEIEDGMDTDYEGLEVVFVSAEDYEEKSSVSKVVCPEVAKVGAIAIDNSSYFRMDDDVPLVVSEVNPVELKKIPKGIVANPNCTTMIAMPVLKPLHEQAILKRLTIASYQAASGAGRAGTSELLIQSENGLDMTKEIAEGSFDKSRFEPGVFNEPIGFNVAASLGAFNKDGSTTEERKFIDESRKILDLGELTVSITCVRVPVFNGHSMSVEATFDKSISPSTANEILGESAGVKVVDIPQPINAAGKDEVLVGRIRRGLDPPKKNVLNMFISGDNLRKGAALNAVQIAELLVKGSS